MRILLVAVVLGSLASCADDGVRHTPDATETRDAAVLDAPADAALAPAMLSGSPGATAFGDVVLGQATAKVTYTISNDGEQISGTLGVLLDSTTSGFALSDNHCSGVALAPHETCTFAVFFQPSVAGLAMTTVHAGASPGGDVARDLTGTGLQPGAIDIVEASHDFLSLAVDAAPATHTFVVKNTGQVPTGVPMPSITGTVNSFSIASTTCTAALAPMATCSVVVHFDPPTVGMKPGSLVVNASPGGSDSATLAGTGFAHVAVTKGGTGGGGTVTSNVTGISCGSGCAADFTTTPVVLTAAPLVGSVFTGWGGDCSGTSTCTLDLTAGKAVTAAFNLQRFVLTTATAGNGQGTVTGAGTYDYNTPVTVTATAATGSTFAGWSGDCSGMGACVVTMTQARSVTATFTLDPETLTVTNGGSGGTVTTSPAGISCGAGNSGTCTHAYDYGTPVTVTAAAATGSVFAGFSGACTGMGPCTVTMTQARSVTATFNVQMLTLTTSTTGSGSGTVTGAGSYAYGMQVTLSESPATGSTFSGWGGDCSGPGTCTVTMTQNRAVSAGFDLNPETLTISNGGTGGTISSSPAGISCASGNTGTCAKDFGYNTPVTLTATPTTGHQLALWAGACSSVPATTPTCTVTMNQAQSVTVRWSPIQYTFNLTFPGDYPGTVTVNGTAYTANTSFAVQYGQTLDMTESTNGLFWTWGGACASQGNSPSCSLTVSGNTDASATFHNTTYRYILKAITQTPNGYPFQVTYPPSLTTTAECTSAQSPGQSCFGSLPAGTIVTLKAHLPPATAFQPVWNNLPTWTGCDTVSADQLTCTFQIFSTPTITVTGDVRAGP